MFLATAAAAVFAVKKGHANLLADATTPATKDLTRLQHHHVYPPAHHGSHITPLRKSGASPSSTTSYDERMMKADAGILSPSGSRTTSYDERGAKMKADVSISSVVASDDPSGQRAAAEEQEGVSTIGRLKSSRKTAVQEEDVSILFMISFSAEQQSSVCASGYIDCDNGKVRGTDQSCKDGCNGDCCVGGERRGYYYACETFTGKVCKDGSCNGPEACGSQSSTPLIVVNSCKGHRACHTTYFPVAINSCKGVFACDGVNSKGNITNSCNGEQTCLSCGGEVGYVSDSCNGKRSCLDLGFKGKIGNIKNSCNSEEACVRGGAGDNHNGVQSSIVSGGMENSCNAYKACYGAGRVQYVCTQWQGYYGQCSSGYFKGAGISTKLSSCCNVEKECYDATEDTLPTQCRGSLPPTSKVCTARRNAINENIYLLMSKMKISFLPILLFFLLFLLFKPLLTPEPKSYFRITHL